MIRTKKIKIRPESYAWLQKCSHEANSVWNFCRFTYALGIERGKWLTGFDLINLTSGASKEFDRIGQDSINNVAKEYALRAKQFRKKKLKYRDNKKVLGWIPIKPAQMAKRKGHRFRFAGKQIRLFESIDGLKFKEGNIVQDSCGDWFLCMPYEHVDATPKASEHAAGLDLGLKTQATSSGGEKLEMSFYRDSEKKLARLQRRGHKKQVKLLHRRIARQRNHAIHEFSTKLIKKYQNIYIGDVSFKFLKSSNGAKSAYDGSISKLKSCLLYKGQQAGRHVEVINEAYTTQACSACGTLSGPTGWTGLVVREWQCGDCGASHDRDVNAAINICHLGMKHHPPSAGTSQNQLGVVSSANTASARQGFNAQPVQA